MDALLNLLPHIVNGLSLGLLFALMALGFMLIVGVMELINLAHGSLFALGAYVAMVVISPDSAWFGSAGEWYASLPLAMRYLFALAMAPAAGFGILVIFLVWLFLEKTPYGAIIKAGAHDSEMVRALGINLTRLRLYVFGLGASLAAIAGIVMTPIWGLRPHVDVDVVIPAFLIIVLGGVGSFWGAVVAGVLVGLTVGLTGAYASEWSLLSMYLLLIAVVTFRVRGLFGKKSALEA